MLTSNAALWRQLHHPLARDLAWCLCGPPLFSGSQAPLPLSEPLQQWFLTLETAPSSLEQWFDQCPHRRLGLLFEHYWHYYWLHFPAPTSKPACEYRFNTQLIEGKKTLGELDALCYQRSIDHKQQTGVGHLVHTELAVKFYLGANDLTLTINHKPCPEQSWLGPNVTDRLDLKWQHTWQKQLQPQRLKAANLPEHWAVDNIEQQLLTRGRLFYPWVTSPNTDVSKDFVTPNPNMLHAQHEKGFWFHEKACERFDGSIPNALWQPLQRSEWLAPVQGSRQKALNNVQLHRFLQEYFEDHQRPLQIAQLIQEGSNTYEICRWFAVPNHWPRLVTD